MGFWKVIYKNVKKKTDRSQTFWSFMKFSFVQIAHFVHILKNSHYAYIPLYMHKSILTLGNVKEQ